MRQQTQIESAVFGMSLESSLPFTSCGYLEQFLNMFRSQFPYQDMNMEELLICCYNDRFLLNK